MLDHAILDQLRGIFSSLDANYTLSAKYSSLRTEKDEMKSFLTSFASTSEHISVEFQELADGNILEFEILKDGEATGIKFCGIPGGHEFTSLLLALLNADGKGKNLPDEELSRRIATLSCEIRLRTFVSLSCTNCPDVVQALNVVALMNSSVSHEMVDGALFADEADALQVQAVPSVYANGELLHVGRGSLGELLQKLEERFGATNVQIEAMKRSYDVIVVGGGPAGASAAIYSARKGLRVAVVAERIGGQVRDTVDIENLISVPHTTGTQLAEALRTHIDRYAIDLYEDRKIERAELLGDEKSIFTHGGEEFVAPAVIIATGAGWRRLNVAGETDYIGHGVAFCPHCDGPFYAGKDVAVIGGGNSGIEAAIDLAGICKKVIVYEYAETLRADTVLQEKARRLKNVEIHTSAQTTEVIGNGHKVTAIRVRDRISGAEAVTPLDGIFVQIGLSANSAPFRDQLETSPIGEIIIDAACRTNIAGVYAAGDVSSVPYKQIVIAMGEGAKAALSAFDDRIRR